MPRRRSTWQLPRTRMSPRRSMPRWPPTSCRVARRRRLWGPRRHHQPGHHRRRYGQRNSGQHDRPGQRRHRRRLRRGPDGRRRRWHDSGCRRVPTDPADALDGDLLNIDVNVAADADIAAPINGAIGANANVAAPSTPRWPPTSARWTAKRPRSRSRTRSSISRSTATPRPTPTSSPTFSSSNG